MQPRKDGFLILAFTGAFSSGCTTAAQFFMSQLPTKRAASVAAKDDVNTSIANFYKHTPADEKLPDSILEMTRTRQVINVLEKLDDVPFIYIPMTNVMNGLLLEHCILTNTTADDVPERYRTLATLALSWANEQGLVPEELANIVKALTSRTVRSGVADKVLRYVNEQMASFRKQVHAAYATRPAELFGIMQSIGNNLRKCGHPFHDEDDFVDSQYLAILAERAVSIIKYHREYIKKHGTTDVRTYFVIECLRNPSEVDYLRRRFHECYLFSIYTGEKERHDRAGIKYQLSTDECVEIDKVDQGGDYVKAQYMQNIKRCVQLADIAVTNDLEPHNVYQELLKYYALIQKPGCIKPTRMERNMNLAYSMSLNSTCICRQVGAVIISPLGFIVGAGWNDTGGGRLGCVYRLRRDVKDTRNDDFPISSARDHARLQAIIIAGNPDHSFCYKDEMKILMEGADPAQRGDVDSGSLQHCRALHAEENAILQTATIGGGALQGTKLYTTTFPCELCAKKIMQVGIDEVIYCEPYPKSVSMDVFFKETMKKIDLTPFHGVKSPSFFRLFKPQLDIKDLQKLEGKEPRDVRPVVARRRPKTTPSRQAITKDAKSVE